MKTMIKLGMFACLALTLNACGKKDESKDPKFGTQESGAISNGKYFLGSATAEYFDNNGGRINNFTMQITGQYSWSMRSLAASKYELTATGNAKFLLNNQLAGEIICSGARDVAHFDVTASNAMVNLRLIESGCPQGLSSQAATQMSIEAVGPSTFIVTFVEVANGQRVVMTYTFNKQ